MLSNLEVNLAHNVTKKLGDVVTNYEFEIVGDYKEGVHSCTMIFRMHFFA